MERVMSELAGYFCQKSDMEVHMVLYGKSVNIFYPVPSNLLIHKPKTVFNNNLRFFHSIGRLLFLRHRVKEIHPDSVLSFGEYWNSFVLIALMGLRFPVFVSDRCQPDKSLGKVHDWLRKTLYPKALGVVAQTEKAKMIYHSQFSHDNIEVIGNPIRDINLRNNIERENIVLMVGRLIKTKNQDKLIELFIRISKPGWRLVIVGYDHLKQNNSEKLRKIIADSNAEKSVILEGKQADVEAFYLKSRIFAFTSSSEGFPNVIGEAMSAGLPVISFDCIAGPSEMINDDRNGYLIPLFDYKQFQEKLEVLMERSDLRDSFGEKAKEDIKAFSIYSIGEKYLQFILSSE